MANILLTKLYLIKEAMERHGEDITPSVSPCSADGFMERDGKVEFWYNDRTHSTFVTMTSKE